MDSIPETGCEQCGAELMTASVQPLDRRPDPHPSNECRRCGHLTGFPTRFYWPRDLQAFVLAKWPGLPADELRRDPATFVGEKLNPWLREQGRGWVEIDRSSRAPTLRWFHDAG